MRPLKLSLMLAMLLSQFGCMTMMTLDAARSSPKKQPTGETAEEEQPAYYLLLPLSVAGDIATLPCQYLCMWLAKASCGCM
jgi:hypothetical protein